MIYDTEGDINFEAWVSYNRDVLPTEVKKYFEAQKDIIRMIFSVRPKIKKYLTPALRKLMYRQYPVLKTETRPLVVQFINEIIEITASELYLKKMFKLVHGHNTGVNIRELYPQLDKLAEYYGSPEKPERLDESNRNEYWWISDTQWESEVEEENRKLLEFFKWEESRKSEFINLVQNMFFKYYNELLDLNSDEWIIFAMNILEEYESFKIFCEHLEEFIDCRFPEEDLRLSDREYVTKYYTLPEDIRIHAREIHDRRIAGERI